MSNVRFARRRAWLGLVISMGMIAVVVGTTAVAASTTVEVWLTTPDGVNQLTQQSDVVLDPIGAGSINVYVNDDRQYQTTVGFGASFSDSSTFLMSQLKGYDPAAYATMMDEIFGVTGGIGLTFWRVPMGASDFTEATEHWTNADTEGPAENPLQYFALTSHDTDHIIPVIQDALAINPGLTIIASPWTAPAWMKTTGKLICSFQNKKGALLPEYRQAWADYFVKWVTAYEGAGVPIWAVTPQNEPQYCPNSYPGMVWEPEEEASWVHDYLRPALAAAGLQPQILGFDHNWDLPSYPTTLVSGPTSSDYGGIAWHCYNNSSDPAEMTKLHNLYPGFDQYETECSSDTEPTDIIPFSTAEMALLSAQNWARGVVLWNLALDSDNGPHLGGCGVCVPVVTIDVTTDPSGVVTSAVYSLDDNYYHLGQISDFVSVGATRIDSTGNAHGIVTAAFENPDGREVLVATNRNDGDTTFTVTWNEQGSFTYTLPSRATVTFIGTVDPAPPTSYVPQAGGTYTVEARPSGKPVDVANGSTSERAKIVQLTDSGDLSQQWVLVDAGAGYVNMINVNSGMALTNPRASNRNGIQMQQRSITGTGSPQQQWQFTAVGNDYYTITNRASDKALDLRDGSVSDGAVIQQWDLDPANPNQQWLFTSAP